MKNTLRSTRGREDTVPMIRVQIVVVVSSLLLCLLQVVSSFQPLPQRPGSSRITYPTNHAWRVADVMTSSSPSLSLAAADDDNVESGSTMALALDPSSETAERICLDTLQLTGEQYAQIQQLTTAVCGWNEKINLVSRKDCSLATVFTRHVLPSLAFSGSRTMTNPFAAENTRVMDVGTGGGFPGLPLAIQYPATTFVLADSVGKKVAAVADMAVHLNLPNVETYHGRVEDYFTTETGRGTEKFDIVTGRSVTSIPQFCAWVQHLLKPDTGHLVYWIGGDVDSDILQHAIQNTAIQERIPAWSDDFDKKMLVFPASAVNAIAASSGVVVVPSKNTKSRSFTTKRSEIKDGKRPKGEWRKKDPNGPRQRGYENFQRYSSTPSSPKSSES
jgi:16S rRNA (guanine527-N7)-methyltransferase